jgi:hypothetical protein
MLSASLTFGLSSNKFHVNALKIFAILCKGRITCDNHHRTNENKDNSQRVVFPTRNVLCLSCQCQHYQVEWQHSYCLFPRTRCSNRRIDARLDTIRCRHCVPNTEPGDELANVFMTRVVVPIRSFGIEHHHQVGRFQAPEQYQ